MKINMIGIHTENLSVMKEFYSNLLGTEIVFESEHYVEFAHEGVRFSLGSKQIMEEHTGEKSYRDNVSGRSFSLAFRVDNTHAVDETFNVFVSKGFLIIKKPEDMPWNQRTFFFADPDGSIHEVFADIVST